ncbi:hypothetical protein [Mycobacteroides abscessus]|uniref:hypothetical protein n=1 Tax=Mycobacteroides abscessus TaxID=36809 RepID=UPI0009264A62|nr:hypothetical protein [Mycobacteroides abscessus]SHQ48309.1 Uncharacterised protein [Mycobacteroides abscessus subsp. abscessus]SKQ85497.1 Uncharacterised protein [Mycobacteroides abscessus subsp. massiliense]SLC48980.1 Uncharacterised protein [Mycobacteroides abscessus subsp. massiliense]
MSAVSITQIEHIPVEDFRYTVLGNNFREEEQFEAQALDRGLPRALGTLYADSASWQWAWTYPLTLEAVLGVHAAALAEVKGLRPSWFARCYTLGETGTVLTVSTYRDEPFTEWEIEAAAAAAPGAAGTAMGASAAPPAGAVTGVAGPKADRACSDPDCVDPDCDGRAGARCVHEQCPECGNSIASIAAQISAAYHNGYADAKKARRGKRRNTNG